MTLLESEIPIALAYCRAPSEVIPAAFNDAHRPANAPAGDDRRTPYSAGVEFHPVPTLSPNALTPAGGDQPHNNMQPYLTFYFCIALQGVFPPRP